jgi:hypothetical protein
MLPLVKMTGMRPLSLQHHSPEEVFLATSVGTKPTVIVVGLHGKQQQIVAEKCGAVARLAFIASSRASTRYSPNADLIVLSRFVPHRFSVAARRLQRVYCGGGLTSICAAILAFIEKSINR